MHSFKEIISSFGFSLEQVRKISENLDDQIDMPDGDYKFKIDKSDIEGLGIICTSSLSNNEIIGKSRFKEKRTPLGRYTNHSNSPNAKMIFDDNENDVLLVTIKDIKENEEITVCYKQVAEDIQGLKSI